MIYEYFGVSKGPGRRFSTSFAQTKKADDDAEVVSQHLVAIDVVSEQTVINKFLDASGRKLQLLSGAIHKCQGFDTPQ